MNVLLFASFAVGVLMLIRGMGANVSGGQILAGGASVAASTAGILSLPAVGLLPAIAGPIGLAVAGVASLLAALGVGSGCGQSCVVASNDANAIEVQMKANLSAFQAGQISQADALATFDALWASLVQACTQIGGGAGKNCIEDRQAGSCKWKDASGNCWNWFVGYRDPIQNAPAPAAAALSLPKLGLLALAGIVIAEVVS